MATKLPVITSTISWPSRQDAEAECQAILRSGIYASKTPITDRRHVDVLAAILSIHPNSLTKTGSGVDYFYIDRVAEVPGIRAASDDIGFWIKQTDSDIADMSYIEAIYPSDQRKKVSSALRAAVDDLRVEYRDRRFSGGSPVVSDVSGLPFTSRAEATVIYQAPTFAQLAYRFAESEGGWTKIRITSGERAPFIGDDLDDPNVRNRWRAFYRKHAALSLATKSEGARRPKSDETAWTP